MRYYCGTSTLILRGVWLRLNPHASGSSHQSCSKAVFRLLVRNTIVALAFVGFFLAAHAEEPHPFTEFFPAGIFGRGDPGMDAFTAGWYAKHLRAFQEPSIREATGSSAETYRFTMLPTFNFPLAVRLIVAPDGSGTAIAKRLTGKGGYDPGNLDFERTNAVTPKQIARFRATLAAHDFWQMPTEGEPIPDGTQWILEVCRDGRYHIVTRNSPKDGDPFGQLCRQLLGLGKLEQIDAYSRERPKTK